MLCYHGVHDGGERPPHGRFAITIHALEAQLATVLAGGRSVVPITGLESCAGGSVMLTFDDNLVSHVACVLPILRAAGLTATFYLSPADLGATGRLSHHDVQALLGAGMFVGAHGNRHIPAVEIGPAEFLRDVKACRAFLEGMGMPLTWAYPGGYIGSFREYHEHILLDQGFTVRFGTLEGVCRPSPLRVQPRYVIRQHSSARYVRAALSSGLQFVSLAKRLRALPTYAVLNRGARMGTSGDDNMPHAAPTEKVEVVEYRFGKKGHYDVASYDALRHVGPSKQYQQMVMANAYRRLIGPLAGKRILDVGCGTGRGVLDFARTASLSVGVDASFDMLATTKGKVNGRHCPLAAAYAQQLPFPDAAFDVVTCLNFLHLFGLATQQTIIAEMKRVVRPGGVLLFDFANALNGLVIGLYRRWRIKAGVSLPSEIRYAIGDNCRIERVYGAPLPTLWRLFYRVPRLGAAVEKIAYIPPFNWLAQGIFCRAVKDAQ